MAEYSIDDILAELDAKKKGIKLPEKNSVEEAPKAEEQTVANETPQVEKAKPPVDLSVTAILDDIVTSA
ncbi:MAG: hypothetical protein IKT78_03135, partial [Ruminiclostridium sp.]|nr:hypothetical protein [Ruminiclostridium sp.]